ncbi:MarR family winged helix-turn-helix transcriptional regulator [Rhodoligotrophos defluvii]|uniref:MarR family winged helix-turn-helix transcriptional regulator n=1 Tax=Rhodoligotrophos defluvii TaxID=2561934 RepID=UPI001485581C|nr:winged helix DNA-binding protein [Rhodoligotrophos defluvii]
MASRKHKATEQAFADAYRPPLTTSRSDFLKTGRDDAFRETIYLLVRSLDRLLACREAFGRAIGLTASQFAVLIGTAYRQGARGVTIRDLAEHVSLASTHVTTEVGRLARKGLLEKVPNAADGRSVLVSLTPKGREAVEAVAPLVREVNDVLFAGIASSDLDILQQTARRLLVNSEEAALIIRRRTRSGHSD